uniref:Conserved hypothetical plastid protein n=1 Tax=Triparma laevis TaxID=1534972 RepID=A0A0K2RX48_9STRA|nr:conserved hypothetical plastid protein [Triparma laevis]BAS19142.1 conserved hypothetical plastid protein [Triparma laevis]
MKINNDLLERGEELLKNSDNKYLTIVKLAKYAKLIILQDLNSVKQQKTVKPLVNSIYNFDKFQKPE